MSISDRASHLIRRYGLTPADLVIEVGSGEGVLLRAVRECGPRVLGIEPDVRAMSRAVRDGVDTVAAFFGVGTADYARRRYGPARVLLARSLPASPEDRAAFLSAATVCLAPDGTIVLHGDAAFAEVRLDPVALPRAA